MIWARQEVGRGAPASGLNLSKKKSLEGGGFSTINSFLERRSQAGAGGERNHGALGRGVPGGWIRKQRWFAAASAVRVSAA